ncbi:cytochrome P450 [Ramlibacter rhizophilus]|uniref:Cytochrome P450 n=1 Tax=Ramlibacter rhizophilus TaxID=1781167 RepID=A0A4Z0BKC0_9BURK|nr:cytochrome P450 [Ramlibacter rhizophilus]TFY99762.1 cytochrome P450 [Ramlibacter rhizophilus]
MQTTAPVDREAAVAVPRTDFDPYADAALDDPYPHYEMLRELGPVFYLSRYEAYGLARHAEIDAVLRDPVTFCSSAGVGLANFHTTEPWRKPSIILEVDPPMHGRTRKVVAGLLAPASIGPLRARFEQEADRLVDRLLEKGRFDAVTDLCEAYPLKVFADAVGIPAEGREQYLLPYGDMVFNAFGPVNERFRKCLAKAQSGAIDWIAEVCKRENLTPGGFGARLYEAADEGLLAPEEAPMLVRTLLSAGLDTTVFTLCNAIRSFTRFPDQWALVHANPSMARQALEEVLRYESTFHSFYRTTTREVEVAGVTMGPEQKVCVFIGSANRDPRRWGDTADRFDVTRRAAGNMAFGTGVHGCAGQMIARLEGEIVLTALARRVKSFEAEGTPVIHYNNSVRGYTSMPVRITAA